MRSNTFFPILAKIMCSDKSIPVCFLLYGVFVFYSYYEKQKVEKQRKLFMMVENILGVLQEHHENLE